MGDLLDWPCFGGEMSALLCWIGDDAGGDYSGGLEEEGRSTLDGIDRASGVKVAMWLPAFSNIEVSDVLVILTLIAVRRDEISFCVTGWLTTKEMVNKRCVLC